MPEPFKNVFNLRLIEGMAEHFHRHYSAFDKSAFIEQASVKLETLELKARSNQIVQAMQKYLPADFDHSAQILIASLLPLTEQLNIEQVTGGTINQYGISGWAIMPMADFVGLAYQNNPEQVNFELAMQVLKEATKRFSAEFGIRYLINAEPEKSMIILNQWATDENYHVRRLASEGSRPRLPWGMQLSGFIDDPKPLITLLEQLKDDNEEYVRRSVANSLNDIAKDHPKLIEDLAENWLKNADKNRIKLIKHACRTLIKKGNKRIFAALGFSPVALKNSELTLNTNTLMFGNSLMLTLKLNSNSHQAQLINIDYIVHHQKANGSTSPKVFKWQSRTLKANEELLLTKKHTIKAITTRVYYPGIHKIEVLINGDVVCHSQFDLIM